MRSRPIILIWVLGVSHDETGRQHACHGGSTRQEPPECHVFIADWIPVLTRAALTAWRPGGRVKGLQQWVWPPMSSGVTCCGS